MQEAHPENFPIEGLQCVETDGACRLSWEWREGIMGYTVRWRRCSDKGKFAWRTVKAKGTSANLEVYGPCDVEIYARNIWGEQSDSPLRLKVGQADDTTSR